jgi:GNAT superfamily N-acetyltransferase
VSRELDMTLMDAAQSLDISCAMRFSLQPVSVGEAGALAALHTAVAEHLTATYGKGPWSSRTTERGVLYAMRTSQVFVAREGTDLVATLRLTTKKPWAIDTRHFTPYRKPLYLLAMAVAPARQRRGIGTRCMEEAAHLARAWPADAIRLDAYDADAGAGPFYAHCGFTEVGRASYRNVPLIYYEQILAA